jgi:putative ABC transport system substrate-binding protein
LSHPVRGTASAEEISAQIDVLSARSGWMRRRELFFLLGGAAMVWPLALAAQQKTMNVIGYLGNMPPGPVDPPMVAFRQALIGTGYVEGKNVAIEYRWVEGH